MLLVEQTRLCNVKFQCAVVQRMQGLPTNTTEGCLWAIGRATAITEQRRRLRHATLLQTSVLAK